MTEEGSGDGKKKRKLRTLGKIDVETFRHPSDAKAIDKVLTKILECGLERLSYVDNVASNLRVTPKTFPRLHKSNDVSEGSGSNDFGDASAQCVDAPDSSIAWGMPAPVTGPVKTTMVVDSAGNGIATAGTECALSGISGRWDKPDPTLGSNVGVTLSSTGQFWMVTTSGNRAARISCWR